MCRTGLIGIQITYQGSYIRTDTQVLRFEVVVCTKDLTVNAVTPLYPKEQQNDTQA